MARLDISYYWYNGLLPMQESKYNPTNTATSATSRSNFFIPRFLVTSLYASVTD